MSRKEDARVVILRAAEAVVAEAGAAHLTLDAVAEKAGVSKGGLLYHFPSKEALLQGMVAYLLEECDAQKAKYEQQVGASPTADLQAHIRIGFEQQIRQPVSGALLAAGANNPKLLDPVRAWHLRNFRQMAKNKRKPIRVAAIMMAMDGVWLNDLMQTSPLNTKERKQLMEELLEMAASAA